MSIPFDLSSFPPVDYCPVFTYSHCALILSGKSTTFTIHKVICSNNIQNVLNLVVPIFFIKN